MFVEEKIWFDVTKVLKKRRKKGKLCKFINQKRKGVVLGKF